MKNIEINNSVKRAFNSDIWEQISDLTDLLMESLRVTCSKKNYIEIYTLCTTREKYSHMATDIEINNLSEIDVISNFNY